MLHVSTGYEADLHGLITRSERWNEKSQKRIVY